MRETKTRTGDMYSRLLELPNLSQTQISQIAMQEDHAVWRSLLKISASNLINDHEQAVTELRLALSQISSFIRDTLSEQSERIYAKVVLCVLANLFNRLLALRRFKEAMEYFWQLYQHINDLTTFRQGLYNLFGFTSLIALDNYNLQANSQFKCARDAQVQFLYTVAKVKMSSGRSNEAKTALQKIVMLSKSMKVSDYLMIRVLQYLAEMEPSRYSEQKEQVMKSMVKQVVFFAEEKASGLLVIKTLLQKQHELRNGLKGSRKGLTHLMVHRYLKIMLGHKQRELATLSESYVQELLHTIQHERNPTVVQQLALNSPFEGVVTQFYNSKFGKLSLICLAYYFRKLLNLKAEKKSRQPKSKGGPRNGNPVDVERARQILKKCIVGAAVRKINVGNSSVVQRYLKIEEKALVWGSSKDDTDYTSSNCKWKHVLGIVYGKVSPNLAKEKFYDLQPWRCFSLITAERSFDFYCENQSDVFFWLQGISYQLQLFHKNSTAYPFYSKGRALWKMTLLKMGATYRNQKIKYKLKHAGAIIEFGKLLP